VAANIAIKRTEASKRIMTLGERLVEQAGPGTMAGLEGHRKVGQVAPWECSS